MSLDVLLDPVTLDLPVFSRHGSGIELTGQRIRVRLQTHLRDWKLDKDAGIDWIGALGKKPIDAEALAAELVVEVKNTPGVKAVTTWSWETSGRTVSVSIRAIADTGEVIDVTASPQGSDGNPSIATAFLGHAFAVVPR